MSRPAVPGDPAKPASARVYNYLLGGHDWYPVDQELARNLEGIYPGLKQLAASNQAYLGHAVLWASGHRSIRQYLDLGSGFPGASSVRDIAQAAAPESRITCIDWDPIVAGPYGYGPVLHEAGVKNVNMVLADIRDVDTVLEAASYPAGLLDFTKPVLAVLGLVLNHMPPDDAEMVVKAYSDALAPGSAVVITTARTDDQDACERLQETWRGGTGTVSKNYTLTELEALFAGLEVQSPGVGPIAGRRPGWKDAKAETPTSSYVIGGIGVKALPQRKDWDGPRVG